jgi:hypothetical protein
MDQEQTLEGAAIPTAVENHKRFGFGENWTRFIQFVDADRIKAAEDSLTAFLGDIHGKTFLDIGSGNGLFSLARAITVRTCTPSTSTGNLSPVPRS